MKIEARKIGQKKVDEVLYVPTPSGHLLWAQLINNQARSWGPGNRDSDV